MPSRPLLPLRAHHFLCLTTFQGKGYSAAFVHQLSSVWRAVRDRAHAQARVLEQADPICGSCPHLQDPADPRSCRSHASVATRDRRLRVAMGWEADQVVDLELAMDRIHARHAELLALVCPGCSWLEICRSAPLTLRGDEPRETGNETP